MSQTAQWEIDALITLDGRKLWQVDELPDGIDAGVLRCLDERDWVEARCVVMQNQEPSPAAPRPLEWFSPVRDDKVWPNWDKFLARHLSGQDNCPGQIRVSEKGKADLVRIRRANADESDARATADGVAKLLKDDEVDPAFIATQLTGKDHRILDLLNDSRKSTAEITRIMKLPKKSVENLLKGLGPDNWGLVKSDTKGRSLTKLGKAVFDSL